MKPLVRQIHSLLIKNNQTLGLAESCTGGIISSLLTSLPGSSKYFVFAVVTYSNKSKEEILKIPVSLIKKNGAVSREVATAMAKNARRIAKADFGIGVTGIAGPGGATANKPVGTVFIAVDSKSKTVSRQFQFNGNRNSIRNKASLKSLLMLEALIKDRNIIS